MYLKGKLKVVFKGCLNKTNLSAMLDFKTNNGTGATSYFLKPDTPVPILFMFSYKTFLVVLLSNVS